MTSHSGKKGARSHLLFQQGHWSLHLSPPIDPKANLGAINPTPLVRLIPPTVPHLQRYQRAFPRYLDSNTAAKVKEAETNQLYSTTNKSVNRL